MKTHVERWARVFIVNRERYFIVYDIPTTNRIFLKVPRTRTKFSYGKFRILSHAKKVSSRTCLRDFITDAFGKKNSCRCTKKTDPISSDRIRGRLVLCTYAYVLACPYCALTILTVRSAGKHITPLTAVLRKRHGADSAGNYENTNKKNKKLLNAQYFWVHIYLKGSLLL